jgi:pilus assembly protein CpaF
MKAPDVSEPGSRSGPKGEDGKPLTDDGLRSPASGPNSSAPVGPEAADDLAGLLDRTDRVLGTGSNRGSRAAPTVPERAPARSTDVRDGDRLSASAPGTMLDLLKPASVRTTDGDALSESERTPPGGKAPGVSGGARDDLSDLKRHVQNELLRRVSKHKASFDGIGDDEFRAKVREIVVGILSEPATAIPPGWTPDALLTELLHDFLGLGALEQFLADDTITEIMVNRHDQIYIERDGRLELTTARFLNENQVRAVIQRIVQPLGRHVDESVPYVDARLPDGSRVHAIIPPLAIDGSKLTIRKFFKNKLTTDDLLRLGSLSRQIARFLEIMVRYRANIMVSGGTGSGKTTLLNVLSNFIPDNQRIITVEDSAELKLNKQHVIALEARAANIEGTGAVTIRELVRNTLRMRPDRVVVGECRGGEALDMLQAMNTGHDGSLTTIHANTSRDALSRLETLVLMAGVELPSRAIREQIAAGIHFVVQTARLPDGSRKLTDITEISGLGENNIFLTQEIFVFKQQGFDAAGRVIGRYHPTGTVPRIVERLRSRGIKFPMEVFAAPAA